MTSPSPRIVPSTSTPPRARKRRAKRGVVAGYIHDISPRHRPVAPVPVVASVPTPVLAAEQAVTAAPPAR